MSQAQTMPPPARTTAPIELIGPAGAGAEEVLTPEALRFVARLAGEFEPRRRELLRRREERQLELDNGKFPTFVQPSITASVDSGWTVAAAPHDLRNRRVEITGPVDRKMIINALNCGANVFMADFEDSNSPTWDNVVRGQQNLRDAVRRTIEYSSPVGKVYRLADQTATLMVRPRGWHLGERHALLNGQPISASLFDFGLYFYHNARELLDRGTGPYFYLPKLENHLEARLWNDIFNFSQRELGIPQGTIRATVLIETILAAFEMEAILWELREHSAGLNCGRWDYIFSLIKKFRAHPHFVLSDRALVKMTTPFMHAYSLLTIKTCHRRDAYAIGGMAAQIPIKNDPAVNEIALDAVRQDKSREVADGHDGTWVAHPGLVPLAAEEFKKMSGDDQVWRKRDDVSVAADDLLRVPATPIISEQGIRTNISVGVQYLEAWLRGSGCVPINNLMEDAATAEISRAQLWQWVHHAARTIEGQPVTVETVDWLMDEEMSKLQRATGKAAFDAGRFADACRLFQQMTHSREIPEFLTAIAYELL